MGRTPDRNRIRRGYDELAGTYAERQSYGDRALAVIEGFLDSLGDRARVLDAGCGHGEPALRRVGDGTAVVGLDLSREQLRLATRAVPGARLVQGDMTALPFREEAFDAVVAYRSVIHVPISERPAVFEGFARVLAPGGVLVFSTAHPLDQFPPDDPEMGEDPGDANYYEVEQQIKEWDVDVPYHAG